MEDFPVNSDYEQDVEMTTLETEGEASSVDTRQEQDTVKLADIKSREVGAKLLAAAGFRGRHSETVDHSFDRARGRGESLVGKNDERRMDAYLGRLDTGIKKHGSRHERSLWGQTVDRLIIDGRNIPEDYWRAQEQILRDNGQGRELSDTEKGMLIEDIQKRQRESLEAWTGYLAHEECPYPLWFKVYTIDGVSKMSVFDKEKRVFRKRDKETVAPYPHFNAAVLGKVYAAIADFYGIDNELGRRQEEAQESQDNEEERAERDAELEALVSSGNFNKLYSRLLMSEKVIAKTPERAEDVHGEWVEYGVGQEEEIASAADGTPWCVASPSVARSYLVEGGYSTDYKDAEDGSDSKAKFILFHLQDEDGRLVDNACASIRLDTNGNVAEISGLGKGQALEDSLVGIVEEKVKTLPGGEVFLERFADKEKLIELDRKMQAGEELSYDELRFIWETDRSITTLDTYNSSDPRIAELRQKYDVSMLANKCIEAGDDIDELISVLQPRDIANSIDKLLAIGANIDIDELISVLQPRDIANSIDKLLAIGANINVNALVFNMKDDDISGSLDKILAAGVDTELLANKLGPINAIKNLDKLRAAGVNIDIDRLLITASPYAIIDNLDMLRAAGVNIDIDEQVFRLDSYYVSRHLDKLLAAGANANMLVSKLDSYAVGNKVRTLLRAGADPNILARKLDPYDVALYFSALVAAGADEAQLRAIIDGGNR